MRWTSMKGEVARPKRCERASIQITSPFLALNWSQSLSLAGKNWAAKEQGRVTVCAASGLSFESRSEMRCPRAKDIKLGFETPLEEWSRYSKPSSWADAGRR